ncbi:uncharacterized protein LOC128801362 isoform X3 [Vidua chalybeata]|uniref:uncharacterized protein LOC128801362 isoform X3 n=1 Tax=Vidua chalybeata TaxID=81927 RepID=UPI0023A83900|nr:uncharacterized protein LOC128801362 isoform X3 [Vidua chalybeata]
MGSAVARVADRLTETMEDGKSMDLSEVSATFVRLADTHFIHCVLPHPHHHPTCPSSSSVPPNVSFLILPTTQGVPPLPQPHPTCLCSLPPHPHHHPTCPSSSSVPPNVSFLILSPTQHVLPHPQHYPWCLS